MDILYHFNNKSDNDENLKINLDDLYDKKQQHDIFTLSSYNKILVRIHNKIKYISKQHMDQRHCWYIIPEILIGIPKYNHKDCTAYIIDKLQENGFIIRYTHPNLLFISWNHWVPSYVRNEIKKKTGLQIDGYGKEINKQSNETNENELENNDSMIFNIKKQNIKDKKNNNFKDIATYKPEGKLIYNNDILKKLTIN